MAKSIHTPKPNWAPDRVYLGGFEGVTCHYTGTAPMTGDALYVGKGQGDTLRHALVTNPNAHEHEARMRRTRG